MAQKRFYILMDEDLVKKYNALCAMKGWLKQDGVQNLIKDTLNQQFPDSAVEG